MSENGQHPPKPRLSAKLLTPRDMIRARVMLEGKNPYEMMDDEFEMLPLIIWCFRSRDDPDFTYEQALDTPFGEYDVSSDDSPPPEAAPEPLSSGSTPELNGEDSERTQLLAPVPGHSSATSTG